ncbi:MAG: AMP-binding protein, partial [Candidatus Dormiibacterota bacterium]
MPEGGNTNERTLRALLQAGDDAAPALVVPGGPRWSYGTLRETVFAAADRLRHLGLGRDDRIATSYPNGAEAVLLFLAAALTGTAAPLNPGYTEEEVRFYLQDTGAAALVVPPDGGEAARAARPEGTLLLEAAVDERGRLLIEGEGRERRDATEPGADDVCLILHTSGTTSRPKRVPLRQRNIAASVGHIVAGYALTPEDVSLCAMPLFHVHGIVASLLSTFASGGTVVAPPGFNALRFWPIVEQERVTWFSAVPTMHQMLLRRADRTQVATAARTLRFARTCSSALAPAIEDELTKLYDAPVLQAYGMTEAAHQMTSNPLPPGERVPGSVGVGTGVEVGIVDEAWTQQPVGRQGEIVVRGPNVIAGYESNPAANASSFRDRWFRTGDAGVLDTRGYLTIVGRLKEMILRGGENIAPAEIDEVLLLHPAVAEAVAFGEPDQMLGEVPVAAVVLSGEVTERELLRHCREHLAAAKVPVRLYMTEQIPRTATGKVQR